MSDHVLLLFFALQIMSDHVFRTLLDFKLCPIVSFGLCWLSNSEFVFSHFICLDHVLTSFIIKSSLSKFIREFSSLSKFIRVFQVFCSSFSSLFKSFSWFLFKFSFQAFLHAFLQLQVWLLSVYEIKHFLQSSNHIQK